jgi:LuxR family maltose regulon positive regulatory protein
VNLSRVLRAQGDDDAALEALREAREIAKSISPWYERCIEAHEVRISLAHGETSAAKRWVEKCGLGSDDRFGYQDSVTYDTLARTFLVQGKLDEAQRVVARLLGMAEEMGAMSSVLHFSMMQAMVFQARGDHERALEYMERALLIGESEGFVRNFIDEGDPVRDLLQQAVGKGIAVSYATKLLNALEAEITDAVPSAERVAQDLVEPLSDRELDVLRLLESHLSTREIAEHLFISVHTARTHVKNIYSKLDVHSRMEAVLRAKEIDLL